ncbi:MAG: alpha-galactosidase [Kiritimatiellae bacterium]|nr:alpha-galactosidase [Kiritimatiellia bacterium]MDD5522908.1 alpha-galactosidase [Kiritimatiellia bacterium]
MKTWIMWTCVGSLMLNMALSAFAGKFVKMEEMCQKDQWSKENLFGPQMKIPFSFIFNGQSSDKLLATWTKTSKTEKIDKSCVQHVITWTDSQTGLEVRCVIVDYTDYPVVEWTAWFTNTGNKPTPIISDIMALDSVFQGVSPVLWHCNGDFCNAEGYTAKETPVLTGQSLAFAPAGGRPCDRAFPYYRLMFDKGGLSIAIGWPAQWSASFTGVDGGVHVKAGQEKTYLQLLPGETIRTPRITVMSWMGDARRAANLWRCWYREHVMPRPNGRPMRPRLVGHGTDTGEEFTAATEENQIRYIEKWVQRGIPIDVWWIDAGWYPCYNKEHKRKWSETGTWMPDPERFPSGLKPVSECAARHGADLLIWFEPERIRPESQLDREHPEWLLKAKGTDNRLLNLGNPACRQWLTDHVCKLIQNNGIKIYRQDFNFEPLKHWRENEEQDRQGMNENLHVQGYLKYWDDLLARNPGLWIDSCSSGGRRNDMETMRRSVPLHYTDFGYGNHPVKLSFHHILFEWLPYFKEATLSWDLQGSARFDHQVDSFSYHCGLGPMIIPCLDIRRDDYDFERVKKMLVIWRRAAELMLNGDYYPLTPIHRSAEKWVVRQFDCSGERCGFIQGIRLQKCPDDSILVHPEGFLPDVVYLFENPETGETRELAGSAVRRDGFTFSCPKREGIIWFYRVK